MLRPPLPHEPEVPQVTQSLGEHLITQARNEGPQFTVATRPLIQTTQDGGFPLTTYYRKGELSRVVERIRQSAAHWATRYSASA